MPKDKTATYLKLLPNMKHEFLEKGYEKASLNHIAKLTGITPAGVYRHFASKEAMFEFLVAPTIAEFEEFCSSSMDDTLSCLDDKDFVKSYNPFEGDWAVDLIEFFYSHFDAFKLLLVCSQGTKYEKFEDSLVSMEEESTRELLREMDRRAIPHTDVSDEEWHIVATTYVSAISEVIKHEFPKEKAHQYVHFIGQFFYPGWREILGFR